MGWRQVCLALAGVGGFETVSVFWTLSGVRHSHAKCSRRCCCVHLVQRSEEPLSLSATLCIQEWVAVAQHRLHAVADGGDRDRQLHQPRAAGRS